MGKLSVLFVIAFVDMVGHAMIVPLLPYYGVTMGMSAFSIGVLVSAFSISQLVSAPLWGRLSDRQGRRKAVLIGLLVTAAAYALFAAADSILLLYASRVLQGLGAGTIGVVQAYVVDASSSRDRVRTLGWLTVVTSLGAVVGPALGSLMVGLGGRAAPGVAGAVLALIVTFFGWRHLREIGVTEAGTHEITVDASHSRLGLATREMAAWRRPASRLMITYAIAVGAFYGTVPIMPLLLDTRFGITEQSVGYTIMYLGLVGVLVRSTLLGVFIGWLGEERLSKAGLICLSIGLALLGASRDYVTLFVSLTVMPLGTAFFFPTVTARLSRSVARDQRGLYMGIQQTYGGISRVTFPLFAGLAMDHVGFGIPFVAAGVLVFAAIWMLPGDVTWPFARVFRAAGRRFEPVN